MTSFKLFDEDEYSVEIVLLETCPCGSSDELYKRERYNIDRLECVNKVRPLGIHGENKADYMNKYIKYAAQLQITYTHDTTRCINMVLSTLSHLLNHKIGQKGRMKNP